MEAEQRIKGMFDYAKTSYLFKSKPGLSKEVVELISKDKNEPEWMLQKRMQAFGIFSKMPLPNWGPSLENLHLDKLTYYAKPDAKKNAKKWEDLPESIRNTFEKLGIPEAEKKSLGGAGAQWESQVVYHNLKKDLEEKGVIFCDMDVAVQKYPELVQKYFMKCVPVNLHKFAALHGAVFSGGSFIYVPKNVKVDLPLQAYFRVNEEKMGQFEHTLIIADEGAEVSYVEGCFVKGTLIATNPGLKPIEEIKEGDKILTHKGDYKKVYFKQVRPYTGNLYKIGFYGDSSLNLEVTEEHPFLYVEREINTERNRNWDVKWIKPKEMKRMDYLVMPINKVVKENSYHEFEIKEFNRKNKQWNLIKENVSSNKEFFKLVGYYLAEGSISSGHYVNFSFGEHENKKIEEVENLVKKLFGIKSIRTFHKKNHGINVVVCSTKLARIFEYFGKGNNKKSIPHWMSIESKEKQKELVIGLFNGDGNYYSKKCKSGFKEVFRINTTSEKLARQVRDILLRLGVFAFLNRRERKKEGRQPIWTIGISGNFMIKFGDMVGIKILKKLHGKKRASKFFVDNKYAYVPIKEIKFRKVIAEPVYNFGVDENESYVANGVIVHNCSSPIYSLGTTLHAGCVELFVHKNARIRYTSVESWAKNVFNLNTKRAIVYDNGTVEWINGNTGSGVTMLYPCSMLVGKNSKSDYLGIAFAGKEQNQDTGSKVYHLAPNTSSTIKAKSISKDGGITTYRGLLRINKGATNSKSNVQCDALMMDNISKSNTVPNIEVNDDTATIGHEATVGKISGDQIFYLMSRGLTQEEATKLIVSGFIEPIVKELPIEYAVELNRLIELEIEGSLG